MSDSDREVIAVKTEIKDELEDMDEVEIYMEDSYWRKCAMDKDPLCGAECSPCTAVKTEMGHEREHGDSPGRGQDSKSLVISEGEILLQRNSEELNNGVIVNKSLFRSESHSYKQENMEMYKCSKSFLRKDGLILHKRIYSGDKSYKCDRCNKSFSNTGNLTRHKRTHTGLKPYKCDECKKSFNNSSHLIRHKRVHTGERPYNCDRCDKSFSNTGNLTKHKRIHTGGKLYGCDQCEKSFRNSSCLTRHKREHNGEKPYKCELCDKSFTRNHNLISHIRTHVTE